MITSLRGMVRQIYEQSIVLEVNGIGFSINLPRTDSIEREKIIEIEIYMHWNQENGPALYGFSSLFEKKTFLLIISCSGIGPKIGLAFLAKLGAANFVSAIATADVKALSSVTGVGTKKAESLILHLKDKIIKLVDNSINEAGSFHAVSTIKKITDVLNSLNYSRAEVNSALYLLKQEKDFTGASFDLLMRKALSHLAKK